MTVLVLGATGLQGGAVARELLAREQPVRILTRNATSPKAMALADRGADVAQGDLTRPDTLSAAFTDIDAVFSVQDYYAPGAGLVGELAQGRAVIAAAKRAGIRHIVQSSMGDSRGRVGPPHFVSKALIERDLRRSGLDWTLLGTVWFMDNLLNPKMKPRLMFPVLAGSLRPETAFPMLAVNDLGWMAAEALTDPRTWMGRKVNLAGDVMTVGEMKDTYRAVTEERPKTWRLPAAIFRRLAPEFAAQLAWHNAVNFAFGTDDLRSVRPNAVDLAGFLRRHSIKGM